MTTPQVGDPLPMLFKPPGVYPAQGDTALLLQALRREAVGPGHRVLDVGTGSGALAVAAARTGARVTAVDVSRRAVATAWLNSALHGRRIVLHRGDLFAPVAGRTFDVIISNPPYVPTAAERLPARGIARAWDAGPTGRAVLDRICGAAPRMLAEDGVLLLVHSALCGVDRTRELLDRAGLRTDVVATARQPFGPVLSARAAWLEQCGLIAAGEREEELVVVRGAR